MSQGANKATGEDKIAQQPLIAATGISKVYRTVSGARVEAIAGIDLVIDDGDFVCIVGPSGCGKSSLLRLVAGLDTVTSGRLTLAGAPVRGPSREVGMVFQNATLLPWMTVLENVGLPLRLVSADPDKAGDDDSLVRELLGVVGLGGFSDKYPYELSGGMQQRAAICRALVRDPKVLLMDEPFGALDALTRERMNVELQRIWQASRKTVLLITHSIAEAVFLGDRVVVMSPRPGRILQDFPVELERPRNFAETTGHPEYLQLTREIRALLDESSGEEAQ
jgi:NitT/TauT family transport system ATP-binding protein